MVIYVDRLLALNALVNYLLLSAAAHLGGETCIRWRQALAAALGALYALAVLLPGCAAPEPEPTLLQSPSACRRGCCGSGCCCWCFRRCMAAWCWPCRRCWAGRSRSSAA